VDSLFLDYGSTNVFRVEVSKGTRVAAYDQAVTVVAGDPPKLEMT
jgi:hypothetical protein